MTEPAARPMRVLMVHNDYQRVGGEQFSVRAEAAALEAAGVDVRLLVESNAGLSSHTPVSSLTRVISSQNSHSSVRQALQEFRPTIVHAQNLFPVLGAGAIRALQEFQVPWIRSLRNYRLRCVSGNCFLKGSTCTRCSTAASGVPGIVHGCYKDSRVASLGAVAYARSEARAGAAYPPDAYLLLSDAMRRLLPAGVQSARTFVKPNAVEAVTDAPLPRDGRTNEILFVGRLSAEKDPEIVFRLAALRPAWTFSVIGEGPLLAAMHEQARHHRNVRMLGLQDHAATMTAMRRAIAIVAPSKWEEPFGRTAAEACAAGTPVVVSSRGGLGDIVRPVDAALVVESDADAAWCAALERIIDSDAQTYARLAAAMLERWRSAFAPEVVTKSLIAIYTEVLASTSRTNTVAV